MVVAIYLSDYFTTYLSTCVQLSHLSTVYLPNKDDKLEFGGGAVEQLALDPIRKLVYVAGTYSS